MPRPAPPVALVREQRLATAQAGTFAVPSRPLLYLHGRNDGCMAPWIAETTPSCLTVPGSRVEMVADAGHFLQLEQPDVVNKLIVGFLAED